jgi:hypothetical protein
MLILRVLAQLLIAAAVMVFGFDALNALRNWAIDPIATGELSNLVTSQLGLTNEMDLEQMIALSEGWPSWGISAWGSVIQAPAFLLLGLLGLTMALLFRWRG